MSFQFYLLRSYFSLFLFFHFSTQNLHKTTLSRTFFLIYIIFPRSSTKVYTSSPFQITFIVCLYLRAVSLTTIMLFVVPWLTLKYSSSFLVFSGILYVKRKLIKEGTYQGICCNLLLLVNESKIFWTDFKFSIKCCNNFNYSERSLDDLGRLNNKKSEQIKIVENYFIYKFYNKVHFTNIFMCNLDAFRTKNALFCPLNRALYVQICK